MTGDGQPRATDWSQYTVSQIWNMLRDEDSDAAVEQYRAWLRIEQICHHHATRLMTAADRLAQTWPAEKGNAAERFRSFVLDLVDGLNATGDAAGRNSTSLRTYYGQIIQTRGAVERLVAQLPDSTTSGGIAAATADHNKLRTLTAEAHRIMTDADKEAQAFVEAAHIPTPFQLTQITDLKPPTEPGGGGGGGGFGGSGGSTSLGSGYPVGSASHPGALGSGTGSLAGGAGTPILAGGVDGSGSPLTPTGGEATGMPAGGPWSPDVAAGAGGGSSAGRVIGGVASQLGRPVAGTHTGQGGEAPRPGSSAATAAAAERAGGGMLGAPMMGGGPVARDGTRVARPGGLIGGDRGKRRRPHDPDDPWAVQPESADPVIGAERSEAGPDRGDELPPGVVHIQGWPR